ncbi:MAG TPA: hypothetical protein VNI20_05780, partial [Fimbriimonadaceae bacterium]|nr:hypothetical protein [Fimbriimonadaceae bacterium]
MRNQNSTLRPLLSAVALLLVASSALPAEIRVEVGATRSPDSIDQLTDAAVRRFAKQTALLGRTQLESMARSGRLKTKFTLPLRVVLTKNGVPLPMVQPAASTGTDLVPTFDPSGTRVFPAAYQTLLENTFSAVMST